MPHIGILEHKYGKDFQKTKYILRGIADCWRESGLKVTVFRGPERFVEVDLAILHVDLTVVPDTYLNFLTQFPATLNGAVTDISKRRISTHLVTCGSGYEGPVIAKTDLNCFGKREAVVRQWNRLSLRPLLENLSDALRGHDPRQLAESGYLIFDSVDQVPQSIWDNPHVVVEKFMLERHDNLYALRTWVFLGDAEIAYVSYGKEPIVKTRNVISRERIDEVPDEVRQVRKKLGFDYGKFDFTSSDGQVCLFDTNRTPSARLVFEAALQPTIKHLAAAVHQFL